MDIFETTICFIGGANLDILKKCPTEKSGFIATGIGIINVAVLSTIVMCLNMRRFLNGNVALSLVLSVFYGFIVFTAYWGIFSLVRRTIKYSIFIIFCIFITIIGFSSIEAVSVMAISPIDIFNGFNNYTLAVTLIIFIGIVCVHLIPVITKLLIYSTAYEAEKENMERKFLTQKEADTIAYNQKYGDYALQFNDANLKIESIKHLSDLFKEYHEVLANVQKETFDFLNNMDKSGDNQKKLLEDCKNSVENQLKTILEKMSSIFNGI